MRKQKRVFKPDPCLITAPGGERDEFPGKDFETVQEPRAFDTLQDALYLIEADLGVSRLLSGLNQEAETA